MRLNAEIGSGVEANQFNEFLSSNEREFCFLGSRKYYVAILCLDVYVKFSRSLVYCVRRFGAVVWHLWVVAYQKSSVKE